MSLTVEEIKKRHDNDTMLASIVIYVRPLLERIKALEDEVFNLQMRSYDAAGAPE